MLWSAWSLLGLLSLVGHAGDVVLLVGALDGGSVFLGDLAELVDFQTDVLVDDFTAAISDRDGGARADKLAVGALEVEVSATRVVRDYSFTNLDLVARYAGDLRVGGF